MTVVLKNMYFAYCCTHGCQYNSETTFISVSTIDIVGISIETLITLWPFKKYSPLFGWD